MRNKMYALLATILHLSNVNFETNGCEHSQINDKDVSQKSLEHAANLLEIHTKTLESLFLEKRIKSGNDITT